MDASGIIRALFGRPRALIGVIARRASAPASGNIDQIVDTAAPRPASTRRPASTA
jgi:hypothetical protein